MHAFGAVFIFQRDKTPEDISSILRSFLTSFEIVLVTSTQSTNVINGRCFQWHLFLKYSRQRALQCWIATVTVHMFDKYKHRKQLTPFRLCNSERTTIHCGKFQYGVVLTKWRLCKFQNGVVFVSMVFIEMKNNNMDVAIFMIRPTVCLLPKYSFGSWRRLIV